MKNKKVVWIIIGIISIALIALAITYAYWQITKTQEGVNEITAACLDISLVDAESGNTGVTLQDKFPLSDTEGAELTPYKFTVTNNCDVAVDYQIALESIGDSTSALKAASLKVMLDDSTTLLNANETVTPTASGAYASHKLGMGTLAKSGDEGSSVTHELRLWIDEDAPVSENNRTYNGKISVTIGQGIKKSLADTLLATYGGESNITSISYEKEDVIISTTAMYVSDTTEKYYWGTTYSVDESENYKLGGTITYSSLDDCRSGANDCGKYTIKNTTSETATYAYLYEITDFNSSGEFGNNNNYVAANTRSFGNGFRSVSEDFTAGIYKAEDDYGDSYYYHGDVKNNYVKFGTYINDTNIEIYTDEIGNPHGDPKEVTISAGTDMYWRIVRINGDGTIRLIYAGTEVAENGSSADDTIYYGLFNNEQGTKTYVGYMYGTDDDPYGDDSATTLTSSTVKQALDTWYENTLNLTYKDYIADRVFCNDREEISTDDSNSAAYKAFERINSYEPSLSCQNKRDRFTVDDTTLGNGHLTYPVGLITADEAMMAGYNSLLNANSLHYISNPQQYWTMTPIHFDPSGGAEGTGFARQYMLNGNMVTFDNGDDYYYFNGASPVINLKADVAFTYDNELTAGTIGDPYVITTE